MKNSISELFSYAKSLCIEATGEEKWKDFVELHNYLSGQGWIVVIIPDFYKTCINFNWQLLVWDKTGKYEDCISDFSTGMYGDCGEYKTYREAMIYGTIRALELYCLYKTIDISFNKTIGENSKSNLMELYNKYNNGVSFHVVDQVWWKYERKTAKEFIDYIKNRLKEIKEWKDA